jgi:excisionase family DNA binding protein
MPDPDLISTAEAAKLAGVDRSTIVRWVRAGKIAPAVTVPGYRGALLFEPSSLDDLTASHA